MIIMTNPIYQSIMLREFYQYNLKIIQLFYKRKKKKNSQEMMLEIKRIVYQYNTPIT